MTASTASPTRSISLLLRLWGREDVGSESPRWAWNDGSQLTRMLNQVVTLGGGVPEEVAIQDGLLHASYTDLFHAARTARQIQALVTGFASVPGRQAAGAIVAILETVGLPYETWDLAGLRTYLEQRAQPAQIFFASLSEKNSPLTASFRMQPVAELGSAQQRYQLYELLWSRKEEATAAALRAAAQRKAASSASTLAAPESSRTDPAKRGSSLREEVTSRFRFALEKVDAAVAPAVAKIVPSGAPGFLRGRYLLFAAVGAVMVCFGTMLFMHQHARTSATVSALPTRNVGIAPGGISAGIGAPPPSAPPPPGTTEKITIPPAPGGVEVHTEVSPPIRKASTPPQPEPPKKTPVSEEPERPARSRGEFSPEQTRQILSRGQAELDRGCYEKAIAYYRRVIEDDPLDSLANAGIDKARRRMQLDREEKASCQ